MDGYMSIPAPPPRYTKSHQGLTVSLAKTAKRTRFHLHTIWLFTLSDLKTIVGPSTAFAVLHKCGRTAFTFDAQDDSRIPSVERTLIALVWTWINLLPFAIDNQRQIDSIEEDKCNKPWRALPTGRITRAQAKPVMVSFYILANILSFYLGASFQSLALVGLGIWYNDLKGADTSWLLRNFINGLGFVSFASGALQVMVQQPVLRDYRFRTWLGVIVCVVASTVQTQDMYDQVGDSKRGRKTAPLVLGDGTARYTIAVGMLFWSWFCPRFWSLPVSGYSISLALGSIIAYRTLTKRSVEEDRNTFKLWNLWLVGIYTLPLLKSWVV